MSVQQYCTRERQTERVHKEYCIPLIKAFVFCNILGSVCACTRSGWSSHVNVMEHDDFLLQVPERERERESKMAREAQRKRHTEKRPSNTGKWCSKIHPCTKYFVLEATHRASLRATVAGNLTANMLARREHTIVLASHNSSLSFFIFSQYWTVCPSWHFVLRTVDHCMWGSGEACSLLVVMVMCPYVCVYTGMYLLVCVLQQPCPPRSPHSSSV